MGVAHALGFLAGVTLLSQGLDCVVHLAAEFAPITRREQMVVLPLTQLERGHAAAINSWAARAAGVPAFSFDSRASVISRR